jgi:hypothetical protein
MPLTFDDRRLLPPGIHDATLEEIERELALSNRRRILFGHLTEYVRGVRLTGWTCQVLVDGSFVMPPVVEPDDVDVILVLPADWDLTRRDFRAFEYDVLDKKHTKQVLRIEVYPVLPDSDRYREFFELFAQIRPEWCELFGWAIGSRKGIVRVTL